MSRGPRVPDDWTPAQKHPDPRRCLFAAAISNGAGMSAAYRAHMAKPGTTAASIKAAAWATAKEEPVRLRIEYLRRRLAERLGVDDAPLTKFADADKTDGRERCRYIDLNADPRTIRSFTITAEEAQVCYDSLDAACAAIGL